MAKPRPASILVTGVAAMDFVFFVEDMPRRAEKYRTAQAAIQGGGGGANAAVAIARLGGRSRFAGRIGKDQVGEMIITSLEKEGVDCQDVVLFDTARSSFASIYVDAAGERQIMSFRDALMPQEPDWLEKPLATAFDAVLADTRWPAGAETLLAAARQKNRPGIIDIEAPVREAMGAMLAASHAAFSSQGLRDWSGHDDLERGIADFARLSGNFTCVTHGEHGAFWHHGDRSGHVPGFLITAVDTLGASNVWHGAFALMLGEGMEAVAAMEFANAAAAIKCGSLGGRAACPDRATVLNFIAARKNSSI